LNNFRTSEWTLLKLCVQSPSKFYQQILFKFEQQ
jgi:hypothetical protein